MNTLLSTKEDIFSWMSNRKKYYYFIHYIGPVIPAVTALTVLINDNSNYFWLFAGLFYFLSAILDLIMGKDHVNHDSSDEKELKSDSFYTNLALVTLPLYFLTTTLMFYTVSVVDMSWHTYLAAAIGMGAMFAGVFCVAHELGHRTKDKLEFFGAQFGLALFGYGHFHVEHNKGHHVHVSTPEDPASSRMGENIYQFALREIPMAFERAMKIESERLKNMNKSFWSFENQILRSYAMTVGLYIFWLALFGIEMLPFLLVASFAGYFQLTMANYLEHYGLLRQKLSDGRYERCQPHHSWNSNYLFTNMMTLQLQRHSDHHASPTRKYQILRDYENVPQLPAGYPFMQFLTIFPPLWRFVMDRRLLEFVNYDLDKVNICPKKREKLYARYHRA